MTRETFVLDTVDNAGDIAQVDRRSILSPRDDEISVAFGSGNLAVRAQNQRTVFAVELPGAGVRRAGPDCGGELVEGDVAGRQGGGIDLDPDGALDAKNLDLRNPGQNVNALLHLRS